MSVNAGKREFVMTESVQSILNLRILTLALGEAQHAGWWRSGFLSPVGLSHLSYVYPRSNFSAAVRAAGRAAKSMHDSSIGIGNVYHLFRLPQQLERRLDDLLQESESCLLDRFGSMLSEPEKLANELGQLGTMVGLSRPQAGPRRMGTIQALQRPETVQQLAAAYHAAFQDGIKLFPYFEGDKDKLR